MSDEQETTQKTTPKKTKGGGSKLVYETLRDSILSLELKPGQPLDETSLAEQFSMSRSPIREALVRLSADGLVEMLSNRSTLVAPMNFGEFPRYVEALDVLQRLTAKLAAMYRTGEDLEKMIEKAQTFSDACDLRDHLLMSASNRDFHVAVAQGGKNPYLTRAYAQLLDEGRRILHMHFNFIHDSGRDALLTDEHFLLIKAIENQDVETAERLAHEHTRQFHNRFVNFMQARYLESFEIGGMKP